MATLELPYEKVYDLLHKYCTSISPDVLYLMKRAAAKETNPDLWTTHPLSSGLPLFLIPELRAVSGNLRQPEVKCFAYK